MTQTKPTAADLLSAKAPVVIRDYFGVDPELNRELAEVKARFGRLQLQVAADPATLEPALAAAREELDRVKAAVRDSGVEVVAQSIGRDAWEKLKLSCPPTEDQIKEYKARGGDGEPDYNWDTFPVPAIAASLVQPVMTEAQVDELWNSPLWNDAECARLFEMALQANTTRQVGNLAF